MNVLSIGNSFSQDAQRYLHEIARKNGCEIDSFNLYIGGCSFARHYRNMLSEKREYDLETNGTNTGFKVSLKEALLNRDWDVVTLQQASHFSDDSSTYSPYAEKLAEYVRTCVPQAKIAVHQTWAYEDGSEKLAAMGYKTHQEMFERVKGCYDALARTINADFILPSGEVFCSLIENGAKNIHRDTFHASRGAGRYALGLLWFDVLEQNANGGAERKASRLQDVIDIDDFDEPIEKADIEKIKAAIKQVLTTRKQK